MTHYGWMTLPEFTDIVAVSQMTPGPIGINAATYVGYTSVINAGYSVPMAVAGSVLTSLSTLLPSIIIMLVVSRFLMRYCNHDSVRTILGILRKLVIGLIAAAALSLMNSANFGVPSVEPWRFAISCVLFLGAFLAINKWKVNPIPVILVAGAVGGVVYTFLPI